MKVIKRIICVLLTIVIIILLAFGGVTIYGRIHYKGFFDNAAKEFEIPELNNNYIPQGITYLKEEDGTENFYLGGYTKDGSASKLYTLDYATKKVTSVRIHNADGTDFVSHCGGLTTDGNNFYICDYEDSTSRDTGRLAVISNESVKTAEDYVSIVRNIKVDVAPAYNYYKDGILYVGEFYRKGNYETAESHHYTTSAGDANTALILAYDLSTLTEEGFGTPVAAYSTTGLVQGMCITDSGKFVLSTSWGLGDSHLYTYDVPETAESTFTLNGESIPLYALDSASLDKDNSYVIPPMSEEVVYVSGRVYTLYESASNKYIFGKFFRETHSYSIAIA